MTKSTGVLPSWKRIRWRSDRYGVVMLDAQVNQFLLARMLSRFDALSTPSGGSSHGVSGTVRDRFCVPSHFFITGDRIALPMAVCVALQDHFQIGSYYR